MQFSSSPILNDLLHPHPCSEAGEASWRGAWEQGDFAGALAGIEADLLSESPPPVTRLCWVRSQLETGKVPAVALCSTLGDLTGSLRALPELDRLSSGSYLAMAKSLMERDQLRLAAVMLDHCLEFASRSPAVSPAELQELNRMQAQVLHEELDRARSRRESKEYMARLSERLAAAEAALTIPSSAVRVEPASEPALPFPEISALRPRQDSPLSARQVAAGAGLTLVLLLLGLGTYFLFFRVGEPALVAMRTVLPDSGEPFLPEIVPSAGEVLATQAALLDGSLDKVGMRLKNLGLTHRPESPPTPKSIEELSKDPEVDQQAMATAAATVPEPTTAPEEELASIGGGDASGNPDPGSASSGPPPYLHPRRLEQLEVADVGGSPQRSPAGEVDTAGEPRAGIYAPPSGAAPDLRGSRALDGRPVRPYEVQQFTDPVVYRTITATKVLAAPSLLAASLSELAPNTSVHVVSRMDQWLELRSTGGRRGYIFAQDAVPAS